MKATRILAVVLGCAMVAAGIWCVANPSGLVAAAGIYIGLGIIASGASQSAPSSRTMASREATTLRDLSSIIACR